MTISRRRILGAFCASAGGVLMPQAFAQTAPEGPAPTTDVPGATPDESMIPTAENPNPPGCIIRDPKEKVSTNQEYWNKHHFIPPSLQNGEVLWGYRATKTPKPELMVPIRQRSTMYAAQEALKTESVLATVSGKRKFYCAGKGNFILSYESGFPPARHDHKMQEMMAKLQNLPAGLRKMSSEQRFFQTLRNLALSFRGIEYEVHTNWEGVPKTLMDLVISGKGDCKDFALARTMFALFMGMRPDHVMMLTYADGRDRASSVGHANMAVYHEKWGWVFVDGTGREQPDRQAEGSSLFYQNDPRVQKAMQGSYPGHMVPLAAQSPLGMFTFDAKWEYSEAGLPRFKPRAPILQRTPKVLLDEFEEVIIPAHDFGPPLMSSTVPGVPGPRVS